MLTFHRNYFSLIFHVLITYLVILPITRIKKFASKIHKQADESVIKTFLQKFETISN